MDTPRVCVHCSLPVGRFGRPHEVHGERLWFCCYGCTLAYQVHHGEHEEPEAAAALIRLGVGGFLAMNVMLFSLLMYAGAFEGEDAWLKAPVHWLTWIVATPLVLLLGAPFFDGAWRALRQRRLSTDTLVSIGVLAAYGYSALQVLRGSDLVYFDTAAMVLLVFTLGSYLEAQARARAARSLAPLLAAERAQVRVVTGTAESLRVVGEVRPGDLARVLPGERIAIDGIVVEGYSACDEAILTGQPLSRVKGAGSAVHAGSINGSGVLLIRASTAGADSRWIRISHQVRDALARKSLAGVVVDRVVAWAIPAVLLLALATTAFWSARAGFDAALLAGMAVLVVACPCSLGLAAPLASALAIAQAAQRGIVLRSGAVLEKLARLRGIAFDKTGTLTRGAPQVMSVQAAGATPAEVLRRAAALACGSDHPVARAIVAAAGQAPIAPARQIEVRAGAGIRGELDGVPHVLGSAAYFAALGWSAPDALRTRPPRGATTAYIGWAQRVHGRIVCIDTVAPEAGAVLAALRARWLATLLVSGDSADAVAPLAAELGIRDWRAQALPEDKVRHLRDWAQRHGPVAMVGDGLNDGPVLAAASVGIAVGEATDLAKESADVVLPRGRLADLPWLLALADRTRVSVRTNLMWAFSYNTVALSLAASGLLRPVIAAALMAVSSVLVAARSWRAAQRADAAPTAAPALPSAAAAR